MRIGSLFGLILLKIKGNIFTNNPVFYDQRFVDLNDLCIYILPSIGLLSIVCESLKALIFLDEGCNSFLAKH
ncbi:hypothetical protein DMA11_04120 [Marinilabiliaceae bacterium JC017]|nr:hypothetical protein DMA11_04120 [Marinilabiliaceae bacterium JC017]